MKQATERAAKTEASLAPTQEQLAANQTDLDELKKNTRHEYFSVADIMLLPLAHTSLQVSHAFVRKFLQILGTFSLVRSQQEFVE